MSLIEERFGSLPIMQKRLVATNKKCDKHPDEEVYTMFLPKKEYEAEERGIRYCWECAKDLVKRDSEQAYQEAVGSIAGTTSWNVLARSIVPNELRGATFDNYQAKTEEQIEFKRRFRALLTRYQQGKVGNAVVFGDVGIGKSHLCLALAKELNAYFKSKGIDKSVLFVTWADLLTKVKSGWNYKDGAKLTEEQAIEKLQRVDYLIIDDLGTKTTEVKEKSVWEQDFLFQILNNRENTIINTNLTYDELRRAFNVRNGSRIMKGIGEWWIDGANITDYRISGINTKGI